MLQNWFPTPVWVHQFTGEELNQIQSEISSKIDKIKNNDLSNPWGDTVKTSFKYIRDGLSECNDLLTYDLTYVKSKFMEQVKLFCNSVKYKLESDIKESWFNFSGPGNFQFDHKHGSFNISGCYYYKTNNNDGNITFANPNSIIFRREIFPSLYCKEQHDVVPNEGLLLLFPGWLTHRVNVNNTGDDRISLTFNI